jgi:hypothetical protein
MGRAAVDLAAYHPIRRIARLDKGERCLADIIKP